MNILVISSIYPEPCNYGITEDTKVVHYFTKYWAIQGHRVIVIHPYYNAVKNIRHFTSKYARHISHTVIDGVDVIFGECQLLIPHALTPSRWRERNLAKRMRKYIEKHFPDFTPDAVSVHFPMVLREFISAFLKGERALAVFHGTDIRLLQSQVLLNSSILCELKQTYSHFLFRSPKLMSTGIGCGLDSKKSNILISGLNDSLIANKDFIDQKIAKQSSVIRLLFAGKIVHQKRIDQILKALYSLKNNIRFQFDILGEGSERKALEKLTVELGLKTCVKFHGAISRDMVSHMMGQADIFIMTSSNETLGLVYLEAMAQGCITIGSKGEGIDGIIVNNKNGFLVNPDDVSEISNCIKDIFEISLCKKTDIINNAYNTVVSLTEKSISEYYYSMLENISLETNKQII